jgi:hypothetical protein
MQSRAPGRVCSVMATQQRFEGSLMTSLAELRAIEEERIASERAAIVAEADAKRRAIEDATRRAEEASRAAAAAVRAEELRIAREREQAEREARMHVEAAEASERARLAAALEADRAQQEMELRRAEVAKKRPTWMVAVTIGAVVMAGALTWFGIERYNAAREADRVAAVARSEADQAKKDADEAKADLERMGAQLAELDGKVSAAVARIADADNAEARAKAKREFDQLRKDQEALEAARRERQRKLDEIERKKQHHMSDDCLHNAVC